MVLRVVTGCSADDAAAIVAQSDAPVLFRQMLGQWPAMRWSPFAPTSEEPGEDLVPGDVPAFPASF